MSAVVTGAYARTGAVDERLALPELIFHGVTGALTDAGCTMADVDGIVIAAHDLVDGRSLSSMITGPAAGAYLRDEIRVSDDALVAVSLGAARIEAGEARRVVVAAWGRPSEGGTEQADRAAYDPFLEQPLGMTTPMVAALRAAAVLGDVPDEVRRRAAEVRHERAGRPTLPAEGAIAPLRPEEMNRPSDAVAALVLSADGPGPRIVGIGHGTDRARIGDRDLRRMPGATAAVGVALGMAGWRPDAPQVVETSGRSLVEEILVLEAAGAAPEGRGFELFVSNPALNPSGAGAAGGCHPVSGLLGLVGAVDQLRGRAGGRQLSPAPSRALVVAGSNLASQTCTAVAIEGV